MLTQHPRELLEQARMALKNHLLIHFDTSDHHMKDLKEKFDDLLKCTDDYLNHRVDHIEYIRDLGSLSKWCDRQLESIAKGTDKSNNTVTRLICFLSLTISSIILCVMGIVLIPSVFWRQKDDVVTFTTTPVGDGKTEQVAFERHKGILLQRFYKKIGQYWSPSFISELLQKDQDDASLLNDISQDIKDANGLINQVLGDKQEEDKVNIEGLRHHVERSLEKSRSQRALAKFALDKGVLLNNIDVMQKDIDAIMMVEDSSDQKVIDDDLAQLRKDLGILAQKLKITENEQELRASFDRALIDKYSKKLPRLMESLVGGTLATSTAITFYVLALLIDGACLIKSLGGDDTRLRIKVKEKYGAYFRSIKRRYDPVLAEDEKLKSKMDDYNTEIMSLGKRKYSIIQDPGNNGPENTSLEDSVYRRDLKEEESKIMSSKVRAHKAVHQSKSLSLFRSSMPGLREKDAKAVWEMHKLYLQEGVNSLTEKLDNHDFFDEYRKIKNIRCSVEKKANEIYELRDLFFNEKLAIKDIYDLLSFANRKNHYDMPAQIVQKIGSGCEGILKCLHDKLTASIQYRSEELGAFVDSTKWQERLAPDNDEKISLSVGGKLVEVSVQDSELLTLLHVSQSTFRLAYMADMLAKSEKVIKNSPDVSAWVESRDKAVQDYLNNADDIELFRSALREIVRLNSHCDYLMGSALNESQDHSSMQDDIDKLCEQMFVESYRPSDNSQMEKDILLKVQNGIYEFKLMAQNSLREIENNASDYTYLMQLSDAARSLLKLVDFSLQHLLLDTAVIVFHVLLVPLEIMYAIKWYAFGSGVSASFTGDDAYKGFFATWGRPLVLAVAEWQSAISHRWSRDALEEYQHDQSVAAMYSKIDRSYRVLDNKMSECMKELGECIKDDDSLRIECRKLQHYCHDVAGDVFEELNAQMCREVIAKDVEIQSKVNEISGDTPGQGQTYEL